MNEGLSIEEEQFQKLRQKEQLLLVFKNTEELKKMITKYRFHQKIQYFLFSIGAAILGWLAYRI